MGGGIPFHILGSSAAMPEADRIVYVDGSAPPSRFRPGVDLELSHWIPTTTPARWAADTSTETCLRFLADPPGDLDGYDLVVNNHVDVDGLLAVFCLAHPDVARSAADLLVGAAELADLGQLSNGSGVRLAQDLTVAMGGFRGPGRDPGEVYADVFARLPALIAQGDGGATEGQRRWEVLQRQIAAFDESVQGDGGPVSRQRVAPRLLSYVQAEVDGRFADQVRIPGFNPLIDESQWLWPQVRARGQDAEAHHLVSTVHDGGWAHDLWLPGYVWAHTPDRWRPPILEPTGDSNTWRIDTRLLAPAVDALMSAEARPGRWILAEELTAFSTVSGRGFPVVLSFVGDDGHPVASSLSPDEVLVHLIPVLGGG